MNFRLPSTSSSALSARPQRPIEYVWPVTAPDGSAGYDRPLENYFDSSMASRLLPARPPTRLYDTIARVHDYRFQVTPDMIDPSWSTPRPLVLRQRERCRSLANLRGNTADYLGISPDFPEWRPRRSSYEDRRGAVGVTPSEVNTLVPYIPPIDTSMPPPSREWLDAMAKQFLADAQADFRPVRPNATTDATDPRSSSHGDSDDFFDYDSDSTFDDSVAVSRISVPHPSQPPPKVESESNSSVDSDSDSASDTDTDTSSNDGYNWGATHLPDSSYAPADPSPWIIPRRRPSVVVVDKGVSVSPSPSDEERVGKRRRGGKSAPYKPLAKMPKRYADDTPSRHGGESGSTRHMSEAEQDSSSEYPLPTPSLGGTPMSFSSVSSVAGIALQTDRVQITPPPPILPQQHAPSVPPKGPKLYPCRLDGCSQVCASAGDLQRHQQSLRHRSPSHGCLACGKSYTRPDALKRHLNSKVACKREYSTKIANNEDGEAGTDAETEAV